MSTVLNIILALFLFGLLVLIHEFGHYIFARIFGVTVNEFSVGMGPVLLSRKSKKTDILYSLRALPIGGYVAMAGEDGQSDDANGLSSKPKWQRAIVLAAGAVMNILLGFILMAVCVTSSPALDSTVVAGFAEGATSCESGLEVGDEIVSVGARRVHIPYDLSYAISYYGAEKPSVTLIRAGEKITLENVTFPSQSESGVTFGVRDFSLRAEKKNFASVCRHTFYQSITTVRVVWESLVDLIRGRYGLEALSGPVGVTGSIGSAASSGVRSLLMLLSLITVNLGIFNLLPFPALDGGRLLFLLIEAVRGKPVKPQIEGAVNFVGLILLFGLMAVVTLKDIIGLFS